MQKKRFFSLHRQFIPQQMVECFLIKHGSDRFEAFSAGMSQRMIDPHDDPARSSGPPEERIKYFRKIRDAIEEKIIRFTQDQEFPFSG